MTDDIRSEREGDLLRVRIDAAERRNALTPAMLDALTAQISGSGHGVIGIVLTGSAKVFSAGADFGSLTGTAADRHYDTAVADVVQAIADARCPVAAAIEGPCLGAAADIALSCDLRVAGQGAFIQIPAVRLGLLYSPAAIARLARAFPRDTVRRLLVLGERFDAATALQQGLVSMVVPTGEAASQALQLLAGLDPARAEALTATRDLLNELESMHYDPDRWEAVRLELLDSPARRQAIDEAKRRHA